MMHPVEVFFKFKPFQKPIHGYTKVNDDVVARWIFAVIPVINLMRGNTQFVCIT